MVRRQSRLGIALLALAFAIAQIAFVAHDATHAGTVEENSCDVCLLGSSPVPEEIHYHGPFQFAISDFLPEIFTQDQPKQIWFSAGSPRSPPQLIA